MHNHPKRRLWQVLVLMVVAGVIVAACGGSRSPSSAAPVAEYSPAGDIPDDQVFVTYAPPRADFSVKVPEGWARSTDGDAVTFTDKLNSVRIESRPAPSAPTVASATSREVPQIAAQTPGYEAGDVTTVTRSAGQAVLITYRAEARPDHVTSSAVQDAVERYEFWRAGTEAVITLSGPVGADNVDPWVLVSDSLSWL